MTILSIDASTKSSGCAIFEENKLIHYECITASGSDKFKRIQKMNNRIKELVNQYHPTVAIMEDVMPQDVKHNQAVYKALIYLQAIIVMTLYDLGIETTFYTASHWRSVVGIHTGRGIKRDELKQASINLVKQKYNITVNDDQADGINIGLAYYMQNATAF